MPCTAELVFRQLPLVLQIQSSSLVTSVVASSASLAETTASPSGASVTGTTIEGTGDIDQILFVDGRNTVVFNSAIGTGAQASFGSTADLATFNGAISAASIYGGASADSLNFTNVVVNGASFGAVQVLMSQWNCFCRFLWRQLLEWH